MPKPGRRPDARAAPLPYRARRAGYGLPRRQQRESRLHARLANPSTNPPRAMRSSRTLGPIPAKQRILIVDDHPLVRRGLTALIDNEPDITVCGEAVTQREGLVAITYFRPDLVITDFWLEEGDGLQLVKEIRLHHKQLPVLLLSMHELPIYAERALQAGANGYVAKQEMADTVLIAIRCVLDGDEYLSPKIRLGLDPRG